MRGRAAIDRTLDRVELSNFGTHRHCSDGVWELIIDYGQGYRIYTKPNSKTTNVI